MWTLPVWNKLWHSHRVYLQGLSSAESAKKYTIGICSYNFLHQGHWYFQISHRRMCRLCITLQWCHNERDGVPNNQPHDCLLNHLFTQRSRKHQSSASLVFVRGIHRWPVNSPHKGPVTRKMFPFDDVIIKLEYWQMTSDKLDVATCFRHQWTLLLTQINFNPSMDKQLHPL